MRKILLVAWREFRHTALTKAFILGAVLTPIGIGAVMLIFPALLKTPLPPLTGTLAIVDPTGNVSPLVKGELTPEQIAARLLPGEDESGPRRRSGLSRRHIASAGNLLPPINISIQTIGPDADVEALKQRVRDGELTALAVIPPTALLQSPTDDENTFDLFVAGDISPFHSAMFEDALAESIVRARVSATGVNLAEARRLVAEPDANIRQLSKSGGEAKESAELKMLIPVAFMMLLWISTFTSGNYLLTSTIEEKSNKVMEVLLSAVSPFELMAGKILGQAAVSFIMLAMYSGVGLAALAVAARMDLIPPILLLYLFIYFIMAYFMVAAIMAGVGSAVSELRDAQSLITPAMLVLMIPLILWLPISNAPNGVLATVSSYIPPLTPFVMILRVTTATEPVPTWQIISSIVAGFCWTIIMVWACAKVFRIGVLMYGKPPTPLELFRWLRYK